MKRSIGVTLLGFGGIIIAMFTLLFGTYEKEYFLFYKEPLASVYYFLYYPLIFLEIWFCVHILKLKEWARRYYVILLGYYLITLIITPLVYNPNFNDHLQNFIKKEYGSLTQEERSKFLSLGEEFRAEIDKQIAEANGERKQQLQEMFGFIYEENEENEIFALWTIGAWIVIVLWFMFYFFWCSVNIIFFTRNKVKRQFHDEITEVIGQ